MSQGICDTGIISGCIIRIAGFSSKRVRHAQDSAQCIIGIGLLSSPRICFLYKVPDRIICIRPPVPQWVHLRRTSSKAVIFIPGDIPGSILFFDQVSCKVVGVRHSTSVCFSHLCLPAHTVIHNGQQRPFCILLPDDIALCIIYQINLISGRI